MFGINSILRNLKKMEVDMCLKLSLNCTKEILSVYIMNRLLHYDLVVKKFATPVISSKLYILHNNIWIIGIKKVKIY